MIDCRGIKEFIERNIEDLYALHRELCLIPAPSGQEEARAQYVCEWLTSHGAEGVYVDGAKNTVFPINVDGSNDISVFVAHTDTVFPDTEPMPFSDDGEIIRCPGVGDDTACLAVLLYTALYFIENNVKPEGGVLFVANSCEEGLGNLKGTRRIFSDYGGRISRFVSFDAQIGVINYVCVGSTRYEVAVKTEGGHSYGAFGNTNAIAALAGIIGKIYGISLPKKEGCRVTYNVGTVEGGTSVNTIAEHASMLCEYRSDSSELLDVMKEKFERIFEEARSDKVDVSVRVVGERPSARGVDETALFKMRDACAEVMESITGERAKFSSSSTDCNIPLSLGIPAVCVGVYIGGGMHTRDEWMEKSSFVPGLEIGIKTALKITEDL